MTAAAKYISVGLVTKNNKENKQTFVQKTSVQLTCGNKI